MCSGMTAHEWSRRRFLKALAAAGTAGFLPRRLLAGDLVRISVLHTTDLHGHILPTVSYSGQADVGGLARCASQIRAWRAENPASLLVDVGDVYQGTDVGWRTRGRVMADCFNHLGYDAWVVGNHEFDWGVEPFANTLSAMTMPALSANATLEGKPSGTLDPAASPFGRVKPWILKEIGGFRIGVLGLTTPGLPYWFQPSFTKGFQTSSPVETARTAARELKEAGADAIIIASHMGTRAKGDDFANQVAAVAAAVPEAAVILAGHTHKDIPSEQVNGVLYTQANYYGLNVGRTDLFFDPSTRRLVRAEAMTARMDSKVAADPAILSLAAKDLAESGRILSAPAGTITSTLSAKSSGPGHPSEIQQLIGASILAALENRQLRTDAVLHGSFSEEDLVAGEKTVADMWGVIPYENFVMTGDLTPEEIKTVLEEIYWGPGKTGIQLMGLQVRFDKDPHPKRIEALLDRAGNPLEAARRYRIAMNTYDASSAGQRLMKLRSIMESPEANAVIHPVQTREALIAFVSSHGKTGVGRQELTVGCLSMNGSTA